MSIITKMRKQNAVYWGPPVEDGDGGFTFPDPVAVACRWDAVEGVVSDERTHEELNNSIVYVDQDVQLNGYLFLGTLEEVGEDSPLDIEGARQITGFEKTPNLKATEFLRKAVV